MTNFLSLFRREQMNREIKVRLDSERKWNEITKAENNMFYSQSFLNKKVAEKIAEKEAKSKKIKFDFLFNNKNLPGKPSTPPPEPENKISGESYFVSPKMFESMNVCRCGRIKSGTHLIKCLQKSVIKYSDGQVSTGSSPIGDKTEEPPNIPKTSNDLCGFYHSKYANLERSTVYITPRSFLKHKITDQIYQSIIIG